MLAQGKLVHFAEFILSEAKDSVQAARAVYPERSEGLAEYEYEHEEAGVGAGEARARLFCGC